jgi:hypothetical protein
MLGFFKDILLYRKLIKDFDKRWKYMFYMFAGAIGVALLAKDIKR